MWIVHVLDTIYILFIILYCWCYYMNPACSYLGLPLLDYTFECLLVDCALLVYYEEQVVQLSSPHTVRTTASVSEMVCC